MSVTWKLLSNMPGSGKYAAGMWLMQDGTVLANIQNSTELLSLHPDGTGSYVTGSWTSAGNLKIQRDFFASAVLSDGRLVVCGGEYSGPGLPQNEGTVCEIYDPITQVSQQFAAPDNWSNIGDAPSVVLNDGTFMLGNTFRRPEVALLNASTLTWTFGVGDQYSEQGYTLLQTGDVLTVSTSDQTSKRYNYLTNAFVSDADVPVVMYDNNNQIGPGITLMDGRVIWFSGVGYTCIYNPGPQGHNGTWIQGPNMPIMPDGSQLLVADDGAILESNGKVFLQCSSTSSIYQSVFVEYDPTLNSIAVVSGSPADGGARNRCRMLLLPNGHGLVSLSTGEWYDVTFAGTHQASWAPTITSFPSQAMVGTTVELAGTQLCGLSECQSFGHDNQQAENYPMVRFEDSATGHVTYARAHGVSTRSISPGRTGTVLVDIPSTPSETQTVFAVAMGIPSNGITVNILPAPPNCAALAAQIQQLLAAHPAPTIPLALREHYKTLLLRCENSLGATETNRLLAALFPPQPPSTSA